MEICWLAFYFLIGFFGGFCENASFSECVPGFFFCDKIIPTKH